MTHRHLVNIREGDTIELVGFPCLENGTLRIVNRDSEGSLYVFCQCGRHILDDGLSTELDTEIYTITNISARETP